MPAASAGDDCLELDCTRTLIDASISTSCGGAVFQFCGGSFTEAELAGIEQASQSHSDVRLLFNDSKVRLVGVHIERLDAGSVRIGGRVKS